MSILATVFQDAVVRAAGQFTFKKFETRLSEYAIIQAFVDNAGIMLPESTIKAVRTAASRVVKIPVLQRYAATLINSYSCVITPDDITSGFKQMNWVTMGFAIGVTPAENANNFITEEDSLAHQFVMGLKAVYTALDNLGYQTLETNKTGVFPSPMYTSANGAYQVPYDQRMEFYAKLPALMQRHDFTGRIVDVANTEALVAKRYIDEQGSQNAYNLSYQTENIDFYRSNRVLTSEGVLETHYDMPPGAIGVYNWVPYEAKNRVKIHEGKLWDQYVDPLFGFTWSVYQDFDCEGGQFVKKWNVVADFAYLTAYSSNSDTAIVKSEILQPVVEA